MEAASWLSGTYRKEAGRNTILTNDLKVDELKICYRSDWFVIGGMIERRHPVLPLTAIPGLGSYMRSFGGEGSEDG